jgi:hypothetical protein
MSVYGVSVILSDLLEAYFLSKYTYNAIEKSDAAFLTYCIYVGSVVLKSVIFVCLLAVIFKEIRCVVEAHTGYVRGREIDSDGEKARILELHNELGRGFGRVIDVAIVFVLSDVLCSLYGAFYAFMDKNMGWFTIVNIACAIIFISATVRAVSDLREAVQTKYMLE